MNPFIISSKLTFWLATESVKIDNLRFESVTEGSSSHKTVLRHFMVIYFYLHTSGNKLFCAICLNYIWLNHCSADIQSYRTSPCVILFIHWQIGKNWLVKTCTCQLFYYFIWTWWILILQQDLKLEHFVMWKDLEKWRLTNKWKLFHLQYWIQQEEVESTCCCKDMKQKLCNEAFHNDDKALLG